jgi:hypothetical protein
MCQLQIELKSPIKSMGYLNISGPELTLQALGVHFFQASQTNEKQKTQGNQCNTVIAS